MGRKAHPASCIIPRVFVLLDPSRRPVIGHRGNRAHAPEDTLVSFAQAVALGVDALELDVRLSRDGVPVIIHDPTLDRTTGATGPVAERTVAELARVDAGTRFSTDGGRTRPYHGLGIGVPTLEEILVTYPAMPCLIEIKAVAAAEPVLRLLGRLHATDRVLMSSFRDEALLPFTAAGLPVSAATRALSKLYLPALVGARPASLSFQAMCIPRSFRGLPLPVAGLTRLMASHGGPVHLWTVNDRATARALWGVGVSGIITDDPAVILAERGIVG